MSSSAGAGRFLVDKCRQKYSWAAGTARGTQAAIQWHKEDLQTAFAEIDGLMAGLQYEENVQRDPSYTTFTSPPPPAPDQMTSRRASPGTRASVGVESQGNARGANQYPTYIGAEDLGSTAASESTPPADDIPSPEHQPMASQWAAIRSLKEETDVHHKRFQQLATKLGNRIITNLRDAYPDARNIRKAGILLFRDVLDGFKPHKLKDIFAFASLSYGISQLLYKSGRIERREILGGLRSWRDLISDQQEKEAFNILARELWPEAKDHLHFIPVPPGACDVPVSDPWPREVTDTDKSSGLGIHHVSLPPSGLMVPGPTNQLFDFTSAEPCLASLADIDTVPYLADLLHDTHEEYDFAALGFATQPSHPNQMATDLPQPIRSTQPEGDPPPRACFDPGEPEISASIEEQDTSRPSTFAPSVASLEETLMFSVIFRFFCEVGELLFILSGRSLASRRYKLYNAEEEDQKRFYQTAQETFFKSRVQGLLPTRPAFLALLTVAEEFTKRGSLRSMAEIKHYLLSIASAVFPPGDLFEQFVSWVLRDNPATSLSTQPNQHGKRPVDENDDPLNARSPKVMKRSYKCEFDGCSAVYADSSALSKHRAQVHTKSPPIRCPLCSYGSPRRDRARSHFKNRHPGYALPEVMQGRTRGFRVRD